MLFKKKPEHVLKLFFALIFVLLFLNVVVIIFTYYINLNSIIINEYIRLFDFNTETNIPTFFSSILLLICGVLLLCIVIFRKNQQAQYIAWLGLALIFFFLSIDEFSSIHEKFTHPTRELLGSSQKGLLYYAWVIPYGIALISLAILYLKFLKSLPPKILKLFLLSGFVFLLGAIGFEMIGGKHVEIHGEENVLTAIYYSIEELLEMLGAALFAYSLLCYIITQFTSFQIIIEEKSKVTA